MGKQKFLAIVLSDFFYTDKNRLYAGVGLNLARETPYNDTGVSNDLAGLIQVVWKVYKFTSPKVSVDVSFNFIRYL